MKKLSAGLLILLGLACPALAQTFTMPPPAGVVVGACVYNATPPTLVTATAGMVQCDSSGNLRISGTVTATVTSTNPIGITPTDRTVTSATGASQTMMAANASRHSLTIVNTGNANCGINPTGGTAVIGGAGTLTLAPLGAYTPRIPTLSAVTVICTAAQPIYGDES